MGPLEGGLERCGRYELLQPITMGAMAHLYLARESDGDGVEKVVVLKRILPYLASNPAFRAMFLDEAKIVARLDHPNIVSVVELGVDDELFIAMEHVGGVDLLALLKRCVATETRIPPRLAVFIARELLSALDFAHSAESEDGVALRIVHRDLSPCNVLISREGQVKLTDFGIAQAAERGTGTGIGTHHGTYSYLSPEQILDQEVDFRADIFALGTLLAEMLIGHHLFSFATEFEVMLAVRDVNLERLDKYGAHIPGSLRAVVLGALAQRAEDRYSSAAAMHAALGEWLQANRLAPSADDLASFVDELSGGTGIVIDLLSAPGDLDGEASRALQRERDQQARVGKALYARGDTAGAPDEDDDDGIIIEEAEPEEVDPDRTADFSDVPALQLLFEIALGGRSGLLVAEQGERLKEAYFERGHPVFVRSNIPEERLGQFLVRKGAINEEQLTRALGVLPHFGGRLGDTLVGLELMTPSDAIRYLAAQVRDKMVDLCEWTEGSARWYEGASNPWPAVALGLDTYDIIGAGLRRIDAESVEAWGLGIVDKYLNGNLPRVDLRSFGLGDQPSEIYNKLDGKRTVGELAQHFASGDDRRDFLRILYLLVCTRAAKVM